LYETTKDSFIKYRGGWGILISFLFLKGKTPAFRPKGDISPGNFENLYNSP
jgi:hypothetical protein